MLRTWAHTPMMSTHAHYMCPMVYTSTQLHHEHHEHSCPHIPYMLLPHTHNTHNTHNTHTYTQHTQIVVQPQEDTKKSTWREIPDVPYYYSSVCVVDGVLLAIGGALDGSRKTSAIYALHPVDQKWQHVGEMPFECSSVDTLLLSGGRLLVVDGISQRVLRVTVEGKPWTCYG